MNKQIDFSYNLLFLNPSMSSVTKHHNQTRMQREPASNSDEASSRTVQPSCTLYGNK